MISAAGGSHGVQPAARVSATPSVTRERVVWLALAANASEHGRRDSYHGRDFRFKPAKRQPAKLDLTDKIRSSNRFYKNNLTGMVGKTRCLYFCVRLRFQIRHCFAKNFDIPLAVYCYRSDRRVRHSLLLVS
jgi:hypothetical protein